MHSALKCALLVALAAIAVAQQPATSRIGEPGPSTGASRFHITPMPGSQSANAEGRRNQCDPSRPEGP